MKSTGICSRLAEVVAAAASVREALTAHLDEGAFTAAHHVTRARLSERRPNWVTKALAELTA